MRHSIIFAVLLCVCTQMFGQTLNDTYRYDGTAQVPSSFLVNTTSAVGIGTTSPAFVLHVAGDMRANLGNYFAETSTGDFGQLNSLLGISPPVPFMSGSGNYYVGSGSGINYRVLSGVIDASSIGPNAIGAAGGIIDDIDGAVAYFAGRRQGGTENVLNLQHVFYDAAPADVDYLKFLNMDNSTYQLTNTKEDFANSTTQTGIIDLAHDDITLSVEDLTDNVSTSLNLTDGFKIVGKDVTSIGFQVLSSSSDFLFRVNNNGKVNVGAETITSGTHTDYKFSVDGKIVTKELIVTTSNWADFVFEADYQLKPLSEVKSFIETNGHLPDVPSAQEIGETGIDLGKTNAMLLMKIEELTLYLLQQQEQIDALKKQIEE